jgi:hypothetical protein
MALMLWGVLIRMGVIICGDKGNCPTQLYKESKLQCRNGMGVHEQMYRKIELKIELHQN